MSDLVDDRTEDSWLSSDVPSNYVCPEATFNCNVTYKQRLEFENSPLGGAGLSRKSKRRWKKRVEETGSVSSRPALHADWISPQSTVELVRSYDACAVDVDWRRRRDKRRTEKETDGLRKTKGKENDGGFDCKQRYQALEVDTRRKPRAQAVDHAYALKPKPHFIWRKRTRKHRPPPEILVEDTPPVPTK